MNALQIAEIKRTAMLISQTEINENKNVYALIKNGTYIAHITTDERVVKSYVQNHNFSVWAIYNNGTSIDVYDNAELHRIMQ